MPRPALYSRSIHVTMILYVRILNVWRHVTASWVTVRGEGGVAGEGRVVGVPKFHSWGKYTMALMIINSDWMSKASSGLWINLFILCYLFNTDCNKLTLFILNHYYSILVSPAFPAYWLMYMHVWPQRAHALLIKLLCGSFKLHLGGVINNLVAHLLRRSKYRQRHICSIVLWLGQYHDISLRWAILPCGQSAVQTKCGKG